MNNTNVIFYIEYVQWIEEALIKAVQLAPPYLTVSIRIFDTGSSSTAQSMDEDSSPSNPTEKNGTHEQVVTRKTSSTSSMLFSLRGVKMERGRSDLDALLKEEVSMASGSMSVSGKHYFHRPPRIYNLRYYISLRVAGYSTRGPSCASLPSLWTF